MSVARIRGPGPAQLVSPALILLAIPLSPSLPLFPIKTWTGTQVPSGAFTGFFHTHTDPCRGGASGAAESVPGICPQLLTRRAASPGAVADGTGGLCLSVLKASVKDLGPTLRIALHMPQYVRILLLSNQHPRGDGALPKSPGPRPCCLFVSRTPALGIFLWDTGPIA